MLEVIVLGHIPGTSLQITFFQVSSVVLLALLLFIIIRERHLQRANPEAPSFKDVVKQISNNPQVLHFAHKALALPANISARRLG